MSPREDDAHLAWLDDLWHLEGVDGCWWCGDIRYFDTPRRSPAMAAGGFPLCRRVAASVRWLGSDRRKASKVGKKIGLQQGDRADSRKILTIPSTSKMYSAVNKISRNRACFLFYCSGFYDAIHMSRKAKAPSATSIENSAACRPEAFAIALEAQKN